MEQNKVDLLRKRLIKKARDDAKEAYSGREVHIAKAVNLLGDLDNVFNLLAEQLIEWYAVHFPELSREVKDNGVYLKLVYELGERGNYNAKKIKEFYEGGDDKVKVIVEAAKGSSGADVGEGEISEIKLLALNALNIKEERGYLAKFIENEMAKVAPNFSELAGSLLGARILAKAGSLKKLAMVPSSTVQLYGAERALFQAKKRGSRGPKYGYIFGHPLVASANPSMKGRIARSLAGKLSIAAREDYFGKEKITGKLKEGLEARAESVKGLKKLPTKDTRGGVERRVFRGKAARGGKRERSSIGLGDAQRRSRRDKKNEGRGSKGRGKKRKRSKNDVRKETSFKDDRKGSAKGKRSKFVVNEKINGFSAEGKKKNRKKSKC